MIRTRMFSSALVAILCAATIGSTAQAEIKDQDHRDLTALPAMKVSLLEAIATAERQTGGRAVGADISERDGASRITVEVAGPRGVTTVMVDGMNGQVVTADAGESDVD